MSDDSNADDNPFGGMPFMGNFANLFSGMGGMFGGAAGDPWAQARQIAASVATGGETESNVDPGDRIAYEQLARVAELHVVQNTGLSLGDGTPPSIRPATRHEYAMTTLDAYRPLLESLSSALSQGLVIDEDGTPLPDIAENPGLPGVGGPDFMAQIMKMLGPMMLSMTAGSMVGQLAKSNLGSFDLPLPRPAASELLVVHPNIVEFTNEWSVPTDDVRLWVCLHEYLHLAVLSVPHVRDRLAELTSRYVASFEPNQAGLAGQFGDIDMSNPESMSDLQGLMNDPEALMGVVQSDTQRAMLPEISALLSAIVGWVDFMMDRIGATLIGSYAMLAEALRRRRVTASPTDRFLERMLGLELDQSCYEQGRAFADGVHERGGDEALRRLWQGEQELPTPNEIVAPGLWLARIDLDPTELSSPTPEEEE